MVAEHTSFDETSAEDSHSRAGLQPPADVVRVQRSVLQEPQEVWREEDDMDLGLCPRPKAGRVAGRMAVQTDGVDGRFGEVVDEVFGEFFRIVGEKDEDVACHPGFCCLWRWWNKLIVRFY